MERKKEGGGREEVGRRLIGESGGVMEREGVEGGQRGGGGFGLGGGEEKGERRRES